MSGEKKISWEGFDASKKALLSVEGTKLIRATDFLPGRTHSEAIEAVFASAALTESVAEIVFDTQDWLLDRAILLPSNRTLTILNRKMARLWLNDPNIQREGAKFLSCWYQRKPHRRTLGVPFFSGQGSTVGIPG
jgi:hypothetical protein